MFETARHDGASEFVVVHRDDSSAVEIVSDVGCPQVRLRCSQGADATRDDAAIETCPQANRCDARASEPSRRGRDRRIERASDARSLSTDTALRAYRVETLGGRWLANSAHVLVHKTFAWSPPLCLRICVQCGCPQVASRRLFVHSPRGACRGSAAACAQRGWRAIVYPQNVGDATVACVVMRASSAVDIAPKRAIHHARLAYPHVSNRIARHWRGYARGSAVENPLVHRRAESNTSTRTIPRSGESSRIPVVHKHRRRRSKHRGISSAHNTTAIAAVDNSASIAPPTRGLHASNAAASPQRLAAITAR